MHLIDSCKQIFSIQLMVTLLIATCVSLSIQNILYEKRFYLYIGHVKSKGGFRTTAASKMESFVLIVNKTLTIIT